MKIFEIREYSNGGFHDQGEAIGYAKENSLEEAEAKHKPNNWFRVREITQQRYDFLKKQAEENMKRFTL